MKIGILTYHRAHNYGAVLQACALKTFLLKQGHKVELIDYWPIYRKGMYDLFDFSYLSHRIGIFKKIIRTIKHVILFPEKLIRYRKFVNFIESNFNINNKNIFVNGKNVPIGFDVYIFGSDQIWRKNKFNNYNGYDPVYWGRYPINSDVKKISYAASMGVMEIDKSEINFIEKHLKNFDLISVREKKLIELLQPFSNKKIIEVLDPVFLLKYHDWMAIASQNIILPKKYLLFYHLVNSKEATELVNKISERLRLKIIEIKGWVELIRNPFRCKHTVGPNEFIALFAKASFVVTTSFHGTAFSIIFKKQFFTLGMRNNADRVKNLLDKLCISNRYIDDVYDYEDPEDIDYNLVNSLLNKEIKKSACFLKAIN